MKLLFDIYHVQIMDGDVIRRIRQHKEYIGHIHTAGNPGRGELDDTQEINYPPIMRALLDSELRRLRRPGVHPHPRSPRRPDPSGETVRRVMFISRRVLAPVRFAVLLDPSGQTLQPVISAFGGQGQVSEGVRDECRVASECCPVRPIPVWLARLGIFGAVVLFVFVQLFGGATLSLESQAGGHV